MHFTSHSTRTQIVFLNLLILVPKSCKNLWKSMSETNSSLLASPERFSVPFWDPKFVQNLFKMTPKPPCTPETSPRWPKMLPRCLRSLAEALKKLARRSKGLPRSNEFGSKKLSRRLFCYHNAKLHLKIRSLHLKSSLVGSMKVSRHSFRTQCKILNS